MTLLTQVMENPLDPGYEAVTRRRREDPDWRPSTLSKVVVLLLTIAIGAGLAIAISSLRSPVGGRNAARELLIDQITERRATQDELTEHNAELNAQILELSGAELALTDPDRRSELDSLAVASGVASVRGPGVVVTLTDSEQAQADPITYGVEAVQAGDLQVVVNALWAGGAEAVAVNGTRIGANGGIRGAGQAILVDRIPVGSPYVVSAIGSREELTKAVASGTTGSYLDVLRTKYRIGIAVAGDDDLWLPGTVTTQLRYAEPLTPTSGQTGPGDLDAPIGSYGLGGQAAGTTGTAGTVGTVEAGTGEGKGIS
ncbi:uncharacterized protein YlxW (UPF0749 family) [Salana multivorans]|uniref:Uncharacterized protein YlxW (UPF0749 family) n=1 Tax=Salana multivorans TaxID=120377 RepID=A0A3N2D179_9MICO|nr:DUF881 domain-containing protein [Salana multivorans]ROR93529.1 uncharacterized protein YlxW (UPF0749 family) [Salana multivorans]